MVNYHNLTPASFFWQWAPDWLGAVETGRQQLHRLVPRVTHAIAVSAFNERDLQAAGYRSTSVVPPFVEVGASGDADGETDGDAERDGAGARWLFVGKLLPHKAAHDIVKAFACYRRAYDPGATLTLVGGQPVAAYAEAVRAFAAAAGVGKALSLPGSVSLAELRRQYRQADVFVCLSDHEGFCFPSSRPCTTVSPWSPTTPGRWRPPPATPPSCSPTSTPPTLPPRCRQRHRRRRAAGAAGCGGAATARALRPRTHGGALRRHHPGRARPTGPHGWYQVTTTVHQLVPSVVPGDATTAHTLEVQRLLVDLGYRSEIYALAVHESLEDRVQLVEELRGPSRRDAFLLYQFSAVSGLADWVLGRREAVALDYHNVTPPELFHPWSRGMALSLVAAQVQVAQLAPRCALGICDSSFNAADLGARGLRSTAVAPILLDTATFDATPDPATMAALERARHPGSSHWLFVGAVAPHKAQHRLVQALAVHRAMYDPGARLSIVGRATSRRYWEALQGLVDTLGLREAVDMPGGVSHEQLVAYYRSADVFVSLSQHEGFCVPLLEAMHHGLPVVAYGAGAVPETMGDGGLVLDHADAPHVAAAVHAVVSSEDTRATLGAAGRARLEHFSLARTGPSWPA